jgi:phage-related protein
MKLLQWLGTSLADVKKFDDDARREAGYQLGKVQDGQEPSDWKPMSTVALGVKEIRIHTATENRVLYVAKFAEAVYVLHAFTKKTQRTDQRDIDIAKRRFAKLAEERKSK